MKKVFEIEWPDNYNDDLLTASYLETLMYSEIYISGVKVDVRETTCRCGISTYSVWDDIKDKYIERCVACERVVV